MRSPKVNWLSKVADWFRYCFSLFTLVRGARLRACRMRVDNMKDLRPERKQVRSSVYPLYPLEV